MVKKIFILLTLAFIAILTVGVLYLRSVNFEKEGDSGFTRNFQSNKIHLVKTLDLGYNSYYVAGMAQSSIYLGNFINTGGMLVMHNILGDTSHFNVEIRETDSIAWAGFSLSVDSPNIYAADLLRSSFFVGEIKDNILYPIKYSPRNSDAVAFISPSSFIIRRLNLEHSQNDLFKVSGDKMLFHNQHTVLNKQMDGVFSIDGSLLYDKTAYKVLYVYFYRNQFISMDSNLSINCTGNTIDTISQAQIQISDIYSTHSQTLVGVPTVVNNKCAADNNILYIESTRRADNQTRQTHQSVIDCYNVENGEYLFSFYLPVSHEKLKSFKVYKDRLVVIADRKLMVYLLLH